MSRPLTPPERRDQPRDWYRHPSDVGRHDLPPRPRDSRDRISEAGPSRNPYIPPPSRYDDYKYSSRRRSPSPDRDDWRRPVEPGEIADTDRARNRRRTDDVSPRTDGGRRPASNTSRNGSPRPGAAVEKPNLRAQIDIFTEKLTRHQFARIERQAASFHFDTLASHASSSGPEHVALTAARKRATAAETEERAVLDEVEDSWADVMRTTGWSVESGGLNLKLDKQGDRLQRLRNDMHDVYSLLDNLRDEMDKVRRNDGKTGDDSPLPPLTEAQPPPPLTTPVTEQFSKMPESDAMITEPRPDEDADMEGKGRKRRKLNTILESINTRLKTLEDFQVDYEDKFDSLENQFNTRDVDEMLGNGRVEPIIRSWEDLELQRDPFGELQAANEQMAAGVSSEAIAGRTPSIQTSATLPTHPGLPPNGDAETKLDNGESGTSSTEVEILRKQVDALRQVIRHLSEGLPVFVGKVSALEEEKEERIKREAQEKAKREAQEKAVFSERAAALEAAVWERVRQALPEMIRTGVSAFAKTYNNAKSQSNAVARRVSADINTPINPTTLNPVQIPLNNDVPRSFTQPARSSTLSPTMLGASIPSSLLSAQQAGDQLRRPASTALPVQQPTRQQMMYMPNGHQAAVLQQMLSSGAASPAQPVLQQNMTQAIPQQGSPSAGLQPVLPQVTGWNQYVNTPAMSAYGFATQLSPQMTQQPSPLISYTEDSHHLSDRTGVGVKHSSGSGLSNRIGTVSAMSDGNGVTGIHDEVQPQQAYQIMPNGGDDAGGYQETFALDNQGNMIPTSHLPLGARMTKTDGGM